MPAQHPLFSPMKLARCLEDIVICMHLSEGKSLESGKGVGRSLAWVASLGCACVSS